MPSNIMTVHAMDLCCIIVGPSYTMSAQPESNIGSACFICVILDLLFKIKIPACAVIVTTTLCLKLGHILTGVQT